jgi:hypothetical protein
MLTAVYHFAVSDLWVRSEVLGTHHTATLADHTITLILPADSADFGINNNAVGLSALGGGYNLLSALGGYNLDSDSATLLAAEVRIIRVEVQVESDLKAPPESDAGNKAAEPGPDAGSEAAEPSVNALDEGIRILSETVKIAREFAQRYINLVRTQLHQFWLGPSESQLRVTWLSQLIDSDGHNIPVGYNDPFPPVLVHWTDSALSVEVQAALVRKASEGVEPDLADTFLNDAEYTTYMFANPNLRQAVLLAAVACEIKIKDTITTLASPEQRSLVNLLLENPRDWTMAAAALFDKGMEAVCGKSLRTENLDLYKEIDLLFRDRNNIAHKGGARVSPDDILIKHISSAKSAFEWLDGILSQARVNAEDSEQ